MAKPVQYYFDFASPCGYMASTNGAIGDPAMKERLKQETEAAIALGSVGSPHIIVDGEPVRGFERFAQTDRWLGT